MNDHHAEHEVVKRLKQFFDAMGGWEANCKASYRKVKSGQMDWEDAERKWIASLKTIFREFCTTWEEPARTRDGFRVDLTPTYGSERIEIMSVTIDEDRATVITQQLDDLGEALTQLDHLLQSGEHPLALVGRLQQEGRAGLAQLQEG
jgi:hypothetical protein